MAYTAQLPLVILRHPSRLAGCQLDVEELGRLGFWVQLHSVDLILLEESAVDGGSQKGKDGSFRDLHFGRSKAPMLYGGRQELDVGEATP